MLIMKENDFEKYFVKQLMFSTNFHYIEKQLVWLRFSGLKKNEIMYENAVCTN